MLVAMVLALATSAGEKMDPVPPLPDRGRVCPADLSKEGDVGFDARTGERFGPAHLAAKDTVRVVIHDENPFLYSYRRVITSAPTDVSLPLAFGSALKVLPEGVRGTFAAPRQGPKPSAATCSDLKIPYDDLKASIDAFQKVAQDAGKGCGALYDATKAVPGAANALVAAWNENMDRQCQPQAGDEASYRTAVDAARSVLAVWSDRSRFIEVTPLSIPDEPTTISVQLYRTALADPKATEERVFSAQIEVGTSRVSVSFGAAWLSLPKRTVARQPYVQADGSSQISFAYDENSASHFAPVLLLHGAIVEAEAFSIFPRSEVGVALGAAVPIAEGPSLDWVLGLSWCFTRTMCLNAGVEFAQVTKIGGSFKVGDPVPSSMQDPLPTTRRWETGGTVGVSWRVK